MPCFRPRFGIYTFPKKVHVYGGRCHSIHLVRSLLVKFACGLHKPRRVRRGPRTPSGRAAKKTWVSPSATTSNCAQQVSLCLRWCADRNTIDKTLRFICSDLRTVRVSPDWRDHRRIPIPRCYMAALTRRQGSMIVMMIMMMMMTLCNLYASAV